MAFWGLLGQWDGGLNDLSNFFSIRVSAEFLTQIVKNFLGTSTIFDFD